MSYVVIKGMTEEYWQKIWLQALDGSSDAFGRVYQEYLHHQLQERARQILKNEQDAEDIVQDVFEYFLRDERYLNIRTHSLDVFRQYMLKTVQHRSLDHLKSLKVERYWLTNASLEHVSHTSIPTEVLRRLQTIRQLQPVGKTRFLTLLRSVIGENMTDEIASLLLNCCRYDSKHETCLSEEQFHSLSSAPVVPDEQYQRAQTLLKTLLTEIQHILTKEEWELIRKKFFLGMTYKEISEEHDSPVSTLQSRCVKIVEKIRNHPVLSAYWCQYLELCEDE
jgi:RNA polymerase sigma factor (sigma-70 family)